MRAGRNILVRLRAVREKYLIHYLFPVSPSLADLVLSGSDNGLVLSLPVRPGHDLPTVFPVREIRSPLLDVRQPLLLQPAGQGGHGEDEAGEPHSSRGEVGPGK